jgi:hypothetical protein
MIFRTILFFVVMYFLVKIISRLFLSANQQQKRQGPGVFYRVFKQYAQQQQQKNQRPPHSESRNNSSNRFEEIEEAEFVEITDEEETTS